MSIEDELKIYEPFYSSFKDEVLNFLLEIKNQHKTTVDIYNIDGRVKSAISVEEKINNSDGKLLKLCDLQNIAGVRVICHCTSDLERFDTILNEELKKKYTEIERQPRSGKSGYRGIHTRDVKFN